MGVSVKVDVRQCSVIYRTKCPDEMSDETLLCRHLVVIQYALRTIGGSSELPLV